MTWRSWCVAIGAMLIYASNSVFLFAELGHRRSGDPMTRKAKDGVASIAVEIAKHVRDPSHLIEYLDHLKNWLDEQSAPFNSLVEWSDIERMSNSVKRLNQFDPPKLESLFAKSKLNEYARSGDSTIVSGAAALRRMQDASDERAAEILALKAQRSKLVALADTYSNADQTAGTIAGKLEALLGNAPVEIACLFEGHSLPISWYDLSEELRPVLADGAHAAKDAANRMDGEIAADESDLNSFDKARTLIGVIWQDVTPAPGPTSIGELQRRMKDEIDETNQRAIALRHQAEDIATANARVDAVKRLLAVGTDLTRLAAEGSRWPHSSSDAAEGEKSSVLIGPDIQPLLEQNPSTPSPPLHGAPMRLQ